MKFKFVVTFGERILIGLYFLENLKFQQYNLNIANQVNNFDLSILTTCHKYDVEDQTSSTYIAYAHIFVNSYFYYYYSIVREEDLKCECLS